MRLIDADELLAHRFVGVVGEGEKWSYMVGWNTAIEAVIENAPTIDAVEVSGTTRKAVELIVGERRLQIAEWGVQSDINLFEFMSILGEEVGELCEAVNETCFVNPKRPERGGRDAIICEAVHVAAVAAQIIEAVLADGQRREEEHNGKHL